MSEDILEFVLDRMAAERERRTPRCWGMSSDALTLYALGKGPRPEVPGRPDRPGGRSWRSSEVGQNYPHDESDLRACELTYAMAPESVQVVMLPVLNEFQAWVREGKNRYGEMVGTPRAGGMTFRTKDAEIDLSSLRSESR